MGQQVLIIDLLSVVAEAIFKCKAIVDLGDHIHPERLTSI